MTERSHGFVRVATAVPRVALAHPRINVDRMLDIVKDAGRASVDLLVFPELCLTGYSCGDLFGQSALLAAADAERERFLQQSADEFAGLIVFGGPFQFADKLFNAAFVCHRGRSLGVVPKIALPNYREYYERRHFAPGGSPARMGESTEALVSPRLLFAADDVPGFVVAVEICEELWTPTPKSGACALAGATIIANPSASTELVGKADYRRQLVMGQSARCTSAYVYAGAGVTESTQDVVFGGHAMIAENGVMLAERRGFQRESLWLAADVDIERLVGDRRRCNTFSEACESETGGWFDRVPFELGNRRSDGRLMRTVPALPFVPTEPASRDTRCEEIFQIQTAALAKRIEAAKASTLNIGISGGLDSTLALLVCAKACDLLGMPRSAIRGLTMPGFGTSEATRSNAEKLMALVGASAERVDIRPLCMEAFASLRHQPFGLDPTGKSVDAFQRELTSVPNERRHDLVFENIQARLRTFLLMSRGFVVGTGDLSELALGWCTYNGDHMSMYGVNVGVPKTLVKFLVGWAADFQFDGPLRLVLHDVAASAISPELLPVGSAGEIQKTEDAVGPYELHDFFLYYFLRFGFGPAKILYLARHAVFSKEYSPEILERWLRVFISRFFANQFKRSCLPDGPKVGSVSLSPRGDWRMPPDAEPGAWLAELD